MKETKKTWCYFHGHNEGIALFSVMAFMTIFFLIGTALLLTTSTECKISQNHRQSIHAFYDCESGLAEALACIKNGTEVLDQWIDASIGTFNYRYFTCFDPNTDIYTITAEGEDPKQKAKRRIVTEVRRLFSSGDIKSPVYCGSGKNKGQPNAIYGDSNCPGWADDGDPNNDLSAPCVVTPNAFETISKPLDLEDDQLFTSAPQPVEYNAEELNLVDMANFYKDLPPDRTSIPVASNETIGSETETKVVYINGNQTLAGQLTGYGILIVTGDLHISGKLRWYGVIIVLGNNVIQTGGGNSGIQVTGAVLTPNHFEIRGNSDVQWCGDVVRKVMSEAGDPLTILSWLEE